MKHANFYLLLLALAAFLFSNCSSMKLASNYKSDNFETIRGKNILVVSRTPQNSIRKSYEEQISKALRAKGINATASHFIFPDLEPLTNKTVDRITNTIAMFRKEGFDILLLTSLKDIEEQEVLRREGEYITMLDYYSNKYITLKGYYDDVHAPPKLGPRETQLEPVTEKSVTFILEAVTYNLALVPDQRLLSVITTKTTNPSSGRAVRTSFANLIAEELK